MENFSKELCTNFLKFLFAACYSCRAFFRRGVGASDQYQCRWGQICKITLKSRTQCQYCRFQKCLEIGMKPTWVMTDKEKKEKREKTIKRKQLPQTLPKIKLQVQIIDKSTCPSTCAICTKVVFKIGSSINDFLSKGEGGSKM